MILNPADATNELPNPPVTRQSDYQRRILKPCKVPAFRNEAFEFPIHHHLRP